MQTYTTLSRLTGPPSLGGHRRVQSCTVDTVSRPKISWVSVPHTSMRATSVPSDQSSQAQADPLLSGNHKSRGGRPDKQEGIASGTGFRHRDRGRATTVNSQSNSSISLRMEASQVLYRREMGFVAQASDLCLRHKSQLSKDRLGQPLS